MTPTALILIPLVPLALVGLLQIPALRELVRMVLPLAPLPAVMVAFDAPTEVLRVDWLLLGAEFAVSPIAAPFLLFTGLLWSLAGWQAMQLLRTDPKVDRFATLVLLAMAGNLGLLVAVDMASFYSLFALMSLSSWGLVLHDGGAAQRYAGRIYISFAILGEIALFAGLAISAAAVGSYALSDLQSGDAPGLALILIGIGFAVKMGLMPLHLWLPPAHAAAPAPASAVLSGSMLKAGLFGMMTLLPFGQSSHPEAALVLAALSVSGILLAGVFGVLQSDAKSTLAFSSIGQTSLMGLGLATALVVPEIWPVLSIALILLAAQHAFAKAALFLGVPIVKSVPPGVGRALILAVAAVPALILAGAPWTGGAEAKVALKTALDLASVGWSEFLPTMLFAASFGTAMLMLRAGWLLVRAYAGPTVPLVVALPWAGMTVLAVAGLHMSILPGNTDYAATWSDVAPILAAVTVAGSVAVALTLSGRRLQLPPFKPAFAFVPQEVQTVKPVIKPKRKGGRTRKKFRLDAQPERNGLTILAMTVGLGVLIAVSGLT